MRRFAWPVAAGAAAALIVALALHGERPQPGLARFAPAGVMADWPVAQVSDVRITASAASRAFRRGAAGEWRAMDDDAPAADDLAEHIETGLKLLHNSAPQRVLGESELAGQPLEAFGLDPPRLTVTATTLGGDRVVVEFGAANPLGLARYARRADRPGLLLLSSFVAEAWERVAKAP